MLDTLLLPFKPRLDGHTELRAQRSTVHAAAILNGNVVNNGSSDVQGLSARAYSGGLWGLASASDCDEKSVKTVLEAAERNAKFLSSRLGEKAPPFTAQTQTIKRSVAEGGDTEQQLVLDFVRGLEAYIAQKYPNLISR